MSQDELRVSSPSGPVRLWSSTRHLPPNLNFWSTCRVPPARGHRGCGCCLHTTPGCVHVTAPARMVLGGPGLIGLVHSPSLGPFEGFFEAIGPDKPGPEQEFCLPGLLTPRSSSAQHPRGCPGRSLQRPSEASSSAASCVLHVSARAEMRRSHGGIGSLQLSFHLSPVCSKTEETQTQEVGVGVGLGRVLAPTRRRVGWACIWVIPALRCPQAGPSCGPRGSRVAPLLC